jgi:hypothetical protein
LTALPKFLLLLILIGPMTGQRAAFAQDSSFTSAGRDSTVAITSDPEGVEIWINDSNTSLVTPAAVKLDSAWRKIEVFKEGREPLTFERGEASRVPESLHFVLRTLPPPVMTSDSLGLTLIQQFPLQDENEANRLMQRYASLAELFAIIPLSQAVIVRPFVDGDDRAVVNALIVAGVGLTVGTYILGKVLSSKKRKDIARQNAEVQKSNAIAEASNREVAQTVREANAAALLHWERENAGRGRVDVIY